MTDAEIAKHLSLMKAIPRETVHLPIATVEQLMKRGHDHYTTPQSRCLEVAADLMEKHKIDRHYVTAVREAARMSTKSIGKVDQKALAKGKVKPIDKAPVSVKAGRKPKADRKEAGYRANAAKARA